MRRLDRQISYGGSVHVQEGGYLARSFKNSDQGHAIMEECEQKARLTVFWPVGWNESILQAHV